MEGIIRKLQMPDITVASYNMSFVSDLGKVFGSEGNFLSRIQTLYPGADPRMFWNNSKDLLKMFCGSYNPAVIGCQEMNLTDEVSAATGTGVLIRELKGINSKFESVVHTVTVKPGVAPTLLTLFDTSVVGEYVDHYGADIPQGRPTDDYITDAAKVPNDLGRPICIILTDKGYILINLHGPNKPEDSLGNNSNKLRTAIQYHFNEALKKFEFSSVNPNKVIILGDFNDPHNAINVSNPLVFTQTGPLTHGRDGVKSCCYNWNSACEESERLTTGTKDCPVPNPVPKAQSISDPPGSAGRGNPRTYIFTGDYCLGKTVKIPLQIFDGPKGPDGSSIASDHELVYATFSVPAAGGYRKKRRTQRKKNRNQKRKRSTRNRRL